MSFSVYVYLCRMNFFLIEESVSPNGSSATSFWFGVCCLFLLRVSFGIHAHSYFGATLCLYLLLQRNFWRYKSISVNLGCRRLTIVV